MCKIKEIIGRVVLKIFGLKRSLKIYYRLKLKRKLNLDNPKRFTEKVQLRKLNNTKNKTYIICADKYKVREYIKEKIGEEYLVPMYFAKSKITVEDLKKLPKSFVLKTNNASATNIVVKDKDKEDLEKIVKTMNGYVKRRFGYRSFELFYNEMEPKIIAEKFIGLDNGSVPDDYKFECFKQKDGTIKAIIQADHGRYSNNHGRVFYNEKWEQEPYQDGYKKYNYDFPKPKNFDQMLKIATKLAKNFDYIRVDLYNVDGKIYFGELTFTDGSGYDIFVPDKYDFTWGDYWNME